MWAARAAWLLVAVLGGQAIGGALEERTRPVQLVGTVGAWIGWALGAGALAVTGLVPLTLVRTVVPASLVIAGAAVLFGAEPGQTVSLVVPALIATAFVGSAELGRVYIQSSAYGDERRFGLRPPIGYLAAAAASWLATAVAVVVAPLAWAANAWIVAAATSAVAIAGLVVLPVRWHQLSRRWLVLVPAGVVVHDPVVLNDTLMLPAGTVASVTLGRPVFGPDSAADLTGPTPGVAIEIALTGPTTAVLAATPRNPTGTAIHLSALIVSPTRPGAVIAAARERHLT